MCSNGWRGIEVWGNPQGCPQDYHWRKYISQGYLNMHNSRIDHAETAVFNGARRFIYYRPHTTSYIGYSIYSNPRYGLSGGTIQLDHDSFYKNYVDVMFQENNFDAMCTSSNCAADGYGNDHQWYSSVQYCLFDTNATYEYCSSWVNDTLNIYHSAWLSNIPALPSPSQPVLCHIVDFNMNPYVWSALFCGSVPANCCSGVNANNAGTSGGSIFGSNIYRGSCTNNPTYH